MAQKTELLPTLVGPYRERCKSLTDHAIPFYRIVLQFNIFKVRSNSQKQGNRLRGYSEVLGRPVLGGVLCQQKKREILRLNPRFMQSYSRTGSKLTITSNSNRNKNQNLLQKSPSSLKTNQLVLQIQEKRKKVRQQAKARIFPCKIIASSRKSLKLRNLLRPQKGSP